MEERSGRIAIRAGHLFETSSGAFADDRGILIEGGRIIAVAPWAELDAALTPADEVVDATDRFVLPGLFNVHVHVTFMYAGGPVNGHEARSVTASTVHAGHIARLLLAQGITTARDMGGPHDIPVGIRDQLAAGALVGPHLLTCNRPISIPGGHASYLCEIANGADEFRAAARRQLALGVDFVKVMASHDPYPMPGDEQTRPEAAADEIAAAFEVAHDWGKPATCHVMGVTAIGRVLEAGVDIIEHGHYLTPAQAQEMSRRGVCLTPTLSSYDVQTMHPRFARGAHWVAAHERLLLGHAAAIAAALEAGVTLLVGTDSVGCYAEEVELLRQAGMPAADSLLACTAWPARALGMSDETGSVDVGRRADLVLLGGDPLADAYALEDVRLVIKDGVPLDPGGLLDPILRTSSASIVESARHPRSAPEIAEALPA